MSYEDVLKLPLKTFWLLNRQLNRLRAEEDLRRLKISVASGSEEGFNTAHGELVKELGSPVIMEDKPNDTVLDQKRFLELQERMQRA